MNKTVYEYLKEAKDILNSMKPFSDMKSYDTISVTYKITGLEADIITYPWKAAYGFPFYDSSLNNLKFCDVAIKDCVFKSIKIVENGLVIECSIQ